MIPVENRKSPIRRATCNTTQFSFLNFLFSSLTNRRVQFFNVKIKYNTKLSLMEWVIILVFYLSYIIMYQIYHGSLVYFLNTYTCVLNPINRLPYLDEL